MSLRNRLYPLLAAALMTAPVAALADPAYTLSFLPDGFDAGILGENGMLAGRVQTASGWAAATYQNGSVTRYDGLGITRISGVSSNGMFTGTLHTSNMAYDHAFIFRDGAVQDIGPFQGQNTTRGFAINAAGQMAGMWYNGPYGGAFLYSNGVMTDMGTLGGTPHTSVQAINEAGEVVGIAQPRNGPGHAYIYSNGVMTDLGTPETYGSEALAINNSGDVAGYMWDWAGNGKSHAFVYINGILQELATSASATSYATGINDDGLVVGSVAVAGNGWGFLYNNGTSVNLNTLIDGTAGWTITGAGAINNAGQILAYACDATAACRDVILNPVSAVPEPGTYAMLLAGLAAIAGQRRRSTAGRSGTGKRV